MSAAKPAKPTIPSANGSGAGDIWEAAATYVRVCLEHERLFPVGNITMRVCADDREHRLFLDEVLDRLVWFRAGSWIEGVDEALRDQFRRIAFERG
ncbi:hypothetical protein JS562_13515 [Agrobacterium sp. S2]|nr:hypothetical protein [Agrobacterium sp. S2]